MKVLFACDGSPYSDRAAKYIATRLHAQTKELQVTLFHVDAPMMARVNRALGAEAVAQYHRENAEFSLRKALQRLRRAGVACETAHAIGSPAEAIAEHAARGKFDLVLMGSHGRGALGGLLLGSVATKVLAQCKVPVLVVT
ncbi:MAG: universal stress protein [Proteobacteria bacterium]|nr:universal stress protein [Pseudomonadota bacterium]